MHYMINLRSILRRKLLSFFFANPHATQYVRELARALDVDPTNLSRELADLEQQGLFQSELRGRQRYYRLNRGYPLYEEIRRIIFKTVGVTGELREALKDIKGLKEGFLYGSFAQQTQIDPLSDIDILLVGKPDEEQLEAAMSRLERQLQREINYTLLSTKEFDQRRKRKDPFLEDVWRKKKINLLKSA
jgi:predicted transcriptional regulator